ncbi:MAG: TerB family tellurite resistance protein [Lachnospiraceae bacterium]|nr:TerB family tellurite resistance protein [Lachnospiraceae bacterium]
MDKNEMQEKLKNTLQGAAGSINNAMQNMKIPDIKLPEQVTGIFKKKESVQNGDDSNVDVAEKEEITAEQNTTDLDVGEKASVQAESQAPKSEENVIRAISTKNAIKVFYYMIAVNGEFSHEEEEKFDEIGKQIDPNFSESKDGIIAECKEQIAKVIDSDDYYDVIQDGVEESILIPDVTADSFITPKLLVWDLLTIAYSDEQYDEKERKLLKYIVRKFNIDSTIFLEMENSLQTLMDIEKETNRIKTTNRPYLTIEAQVNELADRRNIIFESVKDLVML